jgi:hypothetical protein
MNEDLNDCVMCGEDVMHDRAAWLRGQGMLTTCLKCGEKASTAGQAHRADVAQARADGVHG